MAIILNGKELSKEIEKDIINHTEYRRNHGLTKPKLISILVGEDGGSIFYANYQAKISEKLGITYECIKLEESITTEDVKSLIKELNNDAEVNGIMLLLPLPKHIDENEVISVINPDKDVDGLTTLNIGRMYKGEKSFIPCTPQSILRLIKSTGLEIEGKETVIIGRSNIVGKPIAQLMLQENSTITVCHSKTKNLKDVCKRADILISCMGKPKFIDKDYVKEGAIVIDVGTTEVEGKITGDVNFEEVSEIASYISPVPGGVGSLTTNILFLNTCIATDME